MIKPLFPTETATETLPTIEIHPARLRLVGFTDETLAAVAKVFSWPVPGAVFAQRTHKQKHPSPQAWCKACQWDGKRCLLEPDGSLPWGYGARLYDLLAAQNVAYDVAYAVPQTPPEKAFDWTLSADLREYQGEHVEKALNAGRGVIMAATGAGKSIMAAALVCELGLPAIVVVPTKLLAGQFLDTFKQFTDCEVGLIGSGKCVDAPVQVAIAKSLVGNDGTTHAALEGKSVLIIDEMHLSSATTYEAICNACPAAYRYGFSATPYRDSDLEDNLLLGLCGPTIAQIGVEELQESGHLAKTDIRIIPCKVGYARTLYDEEQGQWRETSYGEKYRVGIVQNGYRNKQIADLANAHAADGLKVLVIISWIEHADLITELLDRAPIFLSGQDSPKQTEAKRAQFRDGQGGVCIGTSIVDTGFDVPALDVLILAGGGEFDGRTIQRLGRGLRPSPGKESVIVYDFTDEDKPTFLYHAQSRVKAFSKVGQRVTEYESVAQALAAGAPVREQTTLAV